ncbi:MAG: ABC transporter ATP-binding protein [Acidimicrobiales bacterium]|nr:ABC transporter ATP-binding protein [Acidimicrobiales bacterium]
MTDTLIEARGMSAGYGKMAVVRDVDLRVDAGEVVAVIGANGAGKTTTLLTLAGELSPLEGEVHFQGKRTTAPMHARCRRGLGFVTEERSVIMNMSVADNLRLADVNRTVAFEYFPALEPIIDRRAGLCSGGEQQMLSLARALGREPEVLLVDELSMGLAPIIVTNLLQAVRQAAEERGVGVLLVEQHVRQALKVSDRVYVMERGRIAISGTADEVAGQLDKIEAAYLTG